MTRYRDEVKDWPTTKLLAESHTLRGAITGALAGALQLKPEAFAAAGKAARWAREAAAMGGAVASTPGAVAGLPFLAPLAWGVALKTLAEQFPAAGDYLKDLYHRQLAIGLELHERLQSRQGATAPALATDEP